MSVQPRPVILDDLALNIFTDGSSFSGPRAGGIGIRIITFDNNGKEVPDDYLLPGYQHATNQEMELKACIEALRSPVNVNDYTRVISRSGSAIETHRQFGVQGSQAPGRACVRASYNQKLWMHGRLKGATYPPDC